MNINGFRPMLAAQTDDYDWDKLTYPVYASPKLDGIRLTCLPELGPRTRTLKEVPNHHIHNILSHPLLTWMDGEVCVGSHNAPDVFNKTQSGVMSHDGVPDFKYYVFDYIEAGNMCGFGIRQGDLEQALVTLNASGLELLAERVVKLKQVIIDNYEDLLVFETDCIRDGFEGVIVRSAAGKYKFGRSTQTQQGMLKMKRFIDDEAFIIGWEPLERNQNEAFLDALGLQKRGYSKDGKVIDDTRIGRFRMIGVSGRWEGIEFWCGSGLTDDQRLDYRANVDSMIGRLVTYKYQPHGSLEAPRSPIWKGLRPELEE